MIALLPKPHRRPVRRLPGVAHLSDPPSRARCEEGRPCPVHTPVAYTYAGARHSTYAPVLFPADVRFLGDELPRHQNAPCYLIPITTPTKGDTR